MSAQVIPLAFAQRRAPARLEEGRAVLAISESLFPAVDLADFALRCGDRVTARAVLDELAEDAPPPEAPAAAREWRIAHILSIAARLIEADLSTAMDTQ